MPRRMLLSALAVTSVVLTACGGGSQAEKFVPTSMVSFGDENSAFVPVEADNTVGTLTLKGFKYTVNHLTAARGYKRQPDVSTSVLEPIGLILQSASDFGLPSTATVDPNATQAAWIGWPSPPTAVQAWQPFADKPGRIYLETAFSLNVNYNDGGAKSAVAPVTYQYHSVCTSNPIWVQALASSLGLRYDQDCPWGSSAGRAVSYAKAGDNVQATINQVKANLGGINNRTLVTLMAGQNDVMEQYKLLAPALPAAEASIVAAENELRVRARRLVREALVPVANTGARTLLVHVPDVSLSPLVNKDTAKAALMLRLVNAFNNALVDVLAEGVYTSSGRLIDGRLVGRIDAADMVRLAAQAPSNYALANAKDAVCDAAKLRSVDLLSSYTRPATGTSKDLKYCNDLTLIDKPSTPANAAVPTAYNYFWAMDEWMSPGGHSLLAQRALNRVNNDVF